MTKEDIHIQALLYEDECHNPSVQKHFEDGAEWAREETIKEASLWLSDFLCGRYDDSVNERFVKQFQEAMLYKLL